MLVLLLVCFVAAAQAASFIVGVGIADATGPACDVNFMGYANPSQIGAGIHFRQRARAFIIAQESDPKRKRLVYVSVDFGMGSQAVTREVLVQLGNRFPDYEYSLANVYISGTHTHSAPGGYDQYAIDQLASGGFNMETLQAYSNAIVSAISKAHHSAKKKSRVYFGLGKAEPHTNINRSPTAYLNNPAEERAMYPEGDTEQYFPLLRFETEKHQPMGMFNWFAVHATSMPNTNLLISGDNKGYASQVFEQWMNPNGTLPGHGAFVAGFASSNLGDVSPNVNGTFCKYSGKPCNAVHSTCAGLTEFCLGRGPSKDPFESTKIIGERQARAAREAFTSKMKQVEGSGEVITKHRLVDFSNVTIEPEVTVRLSRLAGGERSLFEQQERRTTCKSALGYSFAAGTTDGPGVFDFYQGETRGNRFWETIRDFIKVPSNETRMCHYPKPVLLPTGEIDFPYAWEPSVMSIGFALLGKSVAMLTVPAEFSTMAGRRLKRLVKDRLVSKQLLQEDGIVILSCLTNAYAHYVVTFEEYQAQRYEGASTLYGPHTLAAYIQEFFKLIDTNEGTTNRAEDDARVPNLIPKAISVLAKPNVDKLPKRVKEFGSVLLDAKPKYKISSSASIVAVEFYSANLRHDLRLEDSYLTVERKLGGSKWQVVYTDSSFETRMMYTRNKLSRVSIVRVEWRLEGAMPGTYRITHTASALKQAGKPFVQFTGRSREFEVEK